MSIGLLRRVAGVLFLLGIACQVLNLWLVGDGSMPGQSSALYPSADRVLDGFPFFLMWDVALLWCGFALVSNHAYPKLFDVAGLAGWFFMSLICFGTVIAVRVDDLHSLLISYIFNIVPAVQFMTLFTLNWFFEPQVPFGPTLWD